MAEPATRGVTTRAVRDAGVTFVEILVAIVLLGTAVIGTLAAVRTTIISTDIERDHAKAQQWLVSAAGAVEGAPFADCQSPPTTGSYDTVRVSYQNAVNTASKPAGFAGIAQVVDVEVWNGDDFEPYVAHGPICFDDTLLRQQRVTIEVRATTGSTVESIQLIKRDRSG